MRGQGTTNYNKKEVCHVFMLLLLLGAPKHTPEVKVKGIEGRYAEDKSIECQYKEVVIPTVAVIWQACDSRDRDIVWKWIEEDLIEWDKPEVYSMPESLTLLIGKPNHVITEQSEDIYLMVFYNLPFPYDNPNKILELSKSKSDLSPSLLSSSNGIKSCCKSLNICPYTNSSKNLSAGSKSAGSQGAGSASSRIRR